MPAWRRIAPQNRGSAVLRHFPISEAELEFRHVRASGPGGQNVNKVSTAVELRFDIGVSRSLPQEVKARLRRLAGRRVSREDVLVIDAGRFRTQEANRRDALPFRSYTAELNVLRKMSSVQPFYQTLNRVIKNVNLQYCLILILVQNGYFF